MGGDLGISLWMKSSCRFPPSLGQHWILPKRIFHMHGKISVFFQHVSKDSCHIKPCENTAMCRTFCWCPIAPQCMQYQDMCKTMASWELLCEFLSFRQVRQQTVHMNTASQTRSAYQWRLNKKNPSRPSFGIWPGDARSIPVNQYSQISPRSHRTWVGTGGDRNLRLPRSGNSVNAWPVSQLHCLFLDYK